MTAKRIETSSASPRVCPYVRNVTFNTDSCSAWVENHTVGPFWSFVLGITCNVMNRASITLEGRAAVR